MSESNFPSQPDLLAPGNAEMLLIEEYKRLSAEMAELNKESSHCITFTLTASVSLWAWLFAHKSADYSQFIAMLPVVATVLWLARWWMLARAMGEIGAYLAETELLFFQNRHGWENHIRRDGKRTGMRSVGKWKLGYFIGLLILNGWMTVQVSDPDKKPPPSVEAEKQRQEMKDATEKLTELLIKAVQ